MGRVVVAPAELDVVSARRFAGELGDERALVVDCSGIEFIDSSGLQVLLEARQRVVGDAGEVILRRPTPVVVRLLRVTSTTDLFTIET